MKYKVQTLNKKHIDKLNKDVIEATLEDNEGNLKEKVQIWQGFPNFETITFDSEVEGDLLTSTKGAYTNTTLYPLKVAKTGQGGGFKSKSIEIAMEKKDASIRGFQANKEESIKLASCMRDATLLAIAEVGKDGATDEILKEKWEKWHKFLTNKYEQPFI